jgi:hypothetical protein
MQCELSLSPLIDTEIVDRAVRLMEDGMTEYLSVYFSVLVFCQLDQLVSFI